MFIKRRPKRYAFDESVDVKSLYEPKPRIDPFKPPDKPEPLKPINDAEGLSKAYADGDTYVYGKTLYVAGSHTARDWYDDLKIPFRQTSNAYRYQKADEALKAHPEVTRVVGHSLGGAVSLELQKNHPERELNSRTYGAPVYDPLGLDRLNDNINKLSTGKENKSERYANILDPVAMMDGSAEHSIFFEPGLSGPHEYDSIARHHFSDV